MQNLFMQISNYYSDGFRFTDSAGSFLGLPSSVGTTNGTTTNNNSINLIITPTPSSGNPTIHMGTQTQELPIYITNIGRSLKGPSKIPESSVTTSLLTSTTSTTTSTLTTFILKPTESPSAIPTETHFTDYEDNFTLDAYNYSNASSSVNINKNFTASKYSNWTSNVTLDDGKNISGYANLTVTNDTTNHSELKKVEFVSRDNTTALVTASTTSTTTNQHSSSTTTTTRVKNGSATTTTTQAKIFINIDNATENITSATLQTSTSSAPITFTHKLTNASTDSTTTFISDDGKSLLNITNDTNDTNGSYVATYENVSSSTTNSTTWVLGSDSKTSTTTTPTKSSTTTTYSVTGTTTTTIGGSISTTISHSGSPTKSPTGFSDSFYINETTDLEIDSNGSNYSVPFIVVKNKSTSSPTPSPFGIHLPTHVSLTPSASPTDAHFIDNEDNYTLDAYNYSNASSSVNINKNFTASKYSNWTSNVTLDDGKNISGYANLTVTNDTTNHSELKKVEFVSRDNTTALVTASTTSTTTNQHSSSTTTTTRVKNGSATTTTTQAKIFINIDNATENITSATLQTSTSSAPITFTHKLTNASTDSTTTFISDDGKSLLNITNDTNDTNGSYVATYENVSSSTTNSTTWVLGSDSKTSTTTTPTKSSTTTTYSVTGTTTTTIGGSISTTISHSGSPTKSPTGFSDSFYINETTDLEIDSNGSNYSVPFKVVKNQTTFSPTPSPIGIHLPTHTKYSLEINESGYDLNATNGYELNSSNETYDSNFSYNSTGWQTNVTAASGEVFSGYSDYNETHNASNQSESTKLIFISKDNQTNITHISNYSLNDKTHQLESSTTSIATTVINGTANTSHTEADLTIQATTTGKPTSVTLRPSNFTSPIIFNETLKNASDANTTTLRSTDGNATISITNESNGTSTVVYETTSPTTSSSSTWTFTTSSTSSTTSSSSTTTTTHATGTTTTSSDGGVIQTTVTHSEYPTDAPIYLSPNQSTSTTFVLATTSSKASGPSSTGLGAFSNGQGSNSVLSNEQGASQSSGQFSNAAWAGVGLGISSLVVGLAVTCWFGNRAAINSIMQIRVNLARAVEALDRAPNEEQYAQARFIDDNFYMRFLMRRGHFTRMTDVLDRAREMFSSPVSSVGTDGIQRPQDVLSVVSDGSASTPPSVAPQHIAIQVTRGATTIPQSQDVVIYDLDELLRTTAGGRLLSGTKAIALKTFSNVDEKIIDSITLLTSAQKLADWSAKKAELLSMVKTIFSQEISPANLNAASVELLTKYLLPTLTSELDAVTMWHLDHEGAVAMLGNTKSFSISKISRLEFTWNINFHQDGAFKSGRPDGSLNAYLTNPDKGAIFSGEGSATRSVHLDDQHTQYVGSKAKDYITLTGKGGATFNIVTDDGDDTVVIPYQIFTDSKSMVNIMGGSGKNTYIIQVKDSWSGLAGNIHIWDFDPTKDTIVFQTMGSFAVPNVRETKRTLFSDPYLLAQINGDGSVLMRGSFSDYLAPQIMDNLPAWFSGSYHAAQHELTGDGIATLKLDENNFDAKNPDKFFANADAFKSDDLGDINGNSFTGAELLLNNTINKQFSQIEAPGDHDFFKVHLSKGESYVFKMEHRPDYFGSGVLTTSLRIKDPEGRDITSSDSVIRTEGFGNSRLDLTADRDGDYYLDASGAGTQSTGKYSISGIEISHTDINTTAPNSGTFDLETSHVGYKQTLSAGDYVEINFSTPNSYTNPTLMISQVGASPIATHTTKDWVSNKQNFLVNKSGDYLIDAFTLLPNGSNANFVLTSNKKDVEGNKATMAVLSKDVVINNKLDTPSDHDWFIVNLTAGQKYQFDMQKAPTSTTYLDTFLRLRDSNGAQIAHNDDVSGNNVDSRLIYKAINSGQYFLDAASYKESSSGNYSLGYKVI